MVVNKLQRGISWDSYTRSLGSNANSNGDWPFGERSGGTDAVNVSEPLVEWKNTFNMRQVTLENIADGISDTAGSKIAIKAAKMHGRNVVNAAKSLDLLRQNIQSAINNDIDRVVKKYLDMYFVPAISNIRGNLGQGSVNEEHVRELCRTMLDEAKHLYLNSPLSRSDSPFNAASDTSTLIESRFGNSQDDTDEDKRLYMFLKRRESEEAGALPSQLLAHKRKSIAANETPCLQRNDPARINARTLFIMSSRVNKVLGCSGIKGRLFIKHPDLFRYCVDAEDREWLIRHKLHYLSHHSPGLSYILILEEVQELLNLDCYRNNTNVLRHELKGFEAPEFMLKKMRAAMNLGRTFSNCQQPTTVATQNSTSVTNTYSTVETTIPEAAGQIESSAAASGVIQPTNVLIQVKEKKKVPKSNWTEDAMQKALRLISRGRSQRYVERKFGIPRRTLRNRLKIAASSRKSSVL